MNGLIGTNEQVAKIAKKTKMAGKANLTELGRMAKMQRKTKLAETAEMIKRARMATIVK